jgi:hypothetical protein
MNRKKAVEIIGSFLILLLLVGSYALSGIGNNKNQATSIITTINNGQAVLFATNYTIQNITDYENSMVININCSNSSFNANTLNFVTQTLADMNASYGINENSYGNEIEITYSNATTMQIYNYIDSKINKTVYAECTVFDANAKVSIPNKIRFKITPIYSAYGNSSMIVSIPSQYSSFSIPVTLKNNMSQEVRLKVSALLTSNYTIYGNISVNRV